MHISCRAFILYNKNILLIHRKKKKNNIYREYYIVPGGKKEDKETDEETLIREIKEEIGIIIKPQKKILEFNSKYDESIQKFYICDYIEGKINTGDGVELKELKENEIFIIEEINIEKLRNIKLVPEEIEEKLKEIIIEIME